MKRLAVLICLWVFAASALAAQHPVTVRPAKASATRFKPLDFAATAARERAHPPAQETEIEEIDAPQPPPPGRRGVPINSANQPNAPQPSSTPSFGTGISPPPAKTFKAEFLSSTSIPPDTMGAVGSTHVVTVTNDRMRILTRDGVEISRLTLSSFWSGVTIKGVAVSAFDPKVFFDRFNNRFILVSSGNGQGQNSGAVFAVSATADPTGTWYRWSVVADPTSTAGGGHWIDYPSVGHNKNWIVIDENVFNFGTAGNNTYFGQQIYVLDKQAAYSNTLGTINLFAGDYNNTCLPSATPETELACGFTMAPAITEDNTTDAEYLLEDWDSVAAQLRLSKVSGTASAPVLTVGTQFPQSSESWRSDAARLGTANNCGGTCSGGYMPQRQQSANLPSSQRVMANDSRIQNVVLRNGVLWTAQTVMLASSSQPAGTQIGGTGNPIDNHSGIQWWSVDPTNETGASTVPLQRGRIFDPAANNCHNGNGGTSAIAPCNGTTSAQFGEFFAFPNISVNRDDDVFIGFSRFSAITYANSGYVLRRAGDPPNTTRDPVIFRPGQANYNIGGGSGSARQNRWGDYSEAQTDPLNDTDFWSVQEYAGTVRDFGIGLAGNWETWWAQVRPADIAPSSSGTLIISQFRLRGPQGARDEFVELYNPGTTPMIVESSDGSEGWALASSANGTGVTSLFAVVPNGVVIPAHGHFLVADNPDGVNGPTVVYSLNGAACTEVRGADSDTGWSLDLADNSGIALFNTASASNFTAGTRLDSVGFSSLAAGLFKEGNGITPITGSPTGQIVFYRDVSSGTPKDTGANENDFIFANTVPGENLGAFARLGAAGPANLGCPTQGVGAATLPASLLDTGAGIGDAPNRQRDSTSVTNGALGTLTIRRTFTNNSGVPIARLRFRIADITTNPPGGGKADLRALTSGNTSVPVSGGGSANVSGTSLETPPAQSAGGGVNATFGVPAVMLATPLGDGQTVNLQFQFGVQTAGTFNICLFGETDGPASAPLSCFSGTTENTPPQLTSNAVSVTAGTPLTGAIITTASDAEDAAGSLSVTATSVPAGITIANIANTNGTITADVSADCTVATGSYSVTLQTSDSEGATATATLTVNVTATPVPSVPTINGTTNGTGTQDQACVEQPLTLNAISSGATSYQWYKDIDFLPGETNASYQANGAATYYVTASNVCGTSSKSAGYVVQNPTPHAPFVTFRNQASTVTSLTICQGANQLIDSDSATGIQWYDNGLPIPGAGSQSYSASQAGVYTAQLDALGCHSQFGRDVTLSLTALPPTPTISPSGSVSGYMPDGVVLTSSSATGNQWYLNGSPIGGATNATYTATGSGSYTVVVSASNCNSLASAATVVTLAPPQADVALTMTDNIGNTELGRTVNYIIEVTNPNGPSTIDVTVTDVLPAGLTGGSWACVPFGGAVCANGFGNTLSDTATLPTASEVAYIYTATVVSGDANDQIVNTASVAPVAGSTDPGSANNSATDTDLVHIFIDGFEGTPLMRPIPVGNGGDYVTATLRVDANLLQGLSMAPTAVAVGRSTGGKALFTLELARFGHDTVFRALTTEANGVARPGTWQPVNLDQHLLSFAWQTALDGNNGYLKMGGINPTVLLVGASGERERLTQLWVTVQSSVPWLVPDTH